MFVCKIDTMASRTRRVPTITDRAAEAEKYRIDQKAFRDNVKEMSRRFTRLVDCAQKLSGLAKGASVECTDGSRKYTITKQDLRGLIKEYRHSLNELPKYFRYAKKAHRAVQTPETGKGVHKRVFVGPAVSQWFSHENFGSGLRDQLKQGQEGYFMNSALNLLFYVAVYQNQLQTDTENRSIIQPSAAMKDAFNGKIPSLYINVGKNKILNETDKNTFAVLAEKTRSTPDPNYRFNPTAFRLIFLRGIVALNVYRPEDLSSEQQAYLEHDGVRQALLQEYYAVKSARDAWQPQLEAERASRRVKTTKTAKTAKKK